VRPAASYLGATFYIFLSFRLLPITFHQSWEDYRQCPEEARSGGFATLQHYNREDTKHSTWWCRWM